MERCIENGKICSAGNKRCKDCKLENCKEVINMSDDLEVFREMQAMDILKKDLPKECKKCPFLVVLDTKKEIVRCPYRVKERCLIK